MAKTAGPKLKCWSLTWNRNVGTDFPTQGLMQSSLGKLNPARYVFQAESGKKTGNLHYQIFLVLKKAMTGSEIRKEMKRFFRSMRSENDLPYYRGGVLSTQEVHDEEAMEAYCSKDDTRLEGTKPVFFPKSRYTGQDLYHYSDMYDWQQEVYDLLLLEKPNDRTVRIIVDYEGNKGKSKLVKYLGFHHNARVIPLGLSAAQMKSAVVNDGPREIYLVDIPRNTKYHEDIFNTLEEIKRGFVVSSYYGQMNDLFMDSPHIVCFMNSMPDLEHLSMDMWEIYTVVPVKGASKRNYELQGEDKIMIEAQQRLKKINNEKALNKYGSLENK